MELIDEKGRLFGRVNIVDALVVLFAIAVLAAGAALVLGGSDTPDTSERMHVTVETADQSATAVTSGRVTYDGADANVTDVYRTPNRTYLRVALDGTRTDDGFQFDRQHVRLGDTPTVATETAVAGGAVTERNTTATFDTETTTVTVEATVDDSVASAISSGDEQRIRDTTVATITGVDTASENATHASLDVTLALETRLADGTAHYGGSPVRLGRTVAVETDGYEFEGEIIQR
jgi:hypothetical protein